MIKEIIMKNVMLKEYTEHKIFIELIELSKFYNDFSYSIMCFGSLGTKNIINIDTYMMSSISGTLESINDVLKNGRISDAYALLRKYYDMCIINIYVNLYLKDNFSIEEFVVEKIDNWLKVKEKLPAVKEMSNYISKSHKLKKITSALQITEDLKEKSVYKLIRNRCNDYIHYNYYKNVIINDNQIGFVNRIKYLDLFFDDLKNILILHLSLLFFLEENYMSSSDYLDYLDCGLKPEEGSQYWVAPFIQKVFDKWIKKYRPDIANIIKNSTFMKLD